MSNLFPSERSQTSTTTTGADSFSKKLASQAFEAGGKVPLQFDGRLTGAPANADQFAGLDLQRTALGGIPADFGQNIISLGNQLANPQNNPLLPGAIDAATRPIFQAGEFANQELLTGAEQFGAAGGSAVRLGQAAIAEGTQRQVGDVGSQLAFQTSESALNRSLSAPGVLNAGFNLTQRPGQQLFNIGSAERGLESIELNENLAQFREDQRSPFAGLEQIARILSGLQFNSSTTQVQQLDPFVQMLQFLLGAGSTGAGIGLLATGNPAGAPLLAAGSNQQIV